MYKTLREESLKRVLPRIIVCAVLAIALLAVSGGGLIRIASGPQALSTLDPEDLNGKYVSFDASQVIVAIATLSTTDGDGNTHVQETYYLLPVGDNQYMTVMDRNQNHESVLSKAMDQSHEYYLGDLETLRTLGMISGTVSATEEDMTSYMTDCIDTYELPGYEEGRDSARLVITSQVNLDKVGFLSQKAALVLGSTALVFLLLLAAQLAAVFAGCYQRKVRFIIGDEENADFENALKIERTRVGKYVWYSKGPGSRAIKTEDIIWGYAMPEPMVVSKYRWPVALYDNAQNLTRIQFMDQKNCTAFLDAIADQGHPFHKGYTSALAEQFQNDFAGFQRDAANEAKARKQHEDRGE